MSSFSQFVGGSGIAISEKNLASDGYIKHPAYTSFTKGEIIFKKLDDFPVALQYEESILVGDIVYSYGGSSSNTMYSKNLNTGEFKTLARGSLGQRRYMGIAHHNGDIYLIGGYDGSNYVNMVFKYNIATNTYTQLANIPANGQPIKAKVYNGKIYCTSISNTVYVYDIATNTWTQGTPMLHACYSSSLQIYNNKLYVIGGHGAANKIQVFDFSTNTWSSIDMPFYTMHGASAIHNDKIYILCGYNGSTYSNELYVYDFTNFKKLPSFSKNIGYPSSALYRNKLHFFNFFIGNVWTSEYWTLDFELVEELENINELTIYIKRR